MDKHRILYSQSLLICDSNVNVNVHVHVDMEMSVWDRVQCAGGQDDFDIDSVELNPAILAALAIILRVDTTIDPMRVRSFSSSSSPQV